MNNHFTAFLYVLLFTTRNVFSFKEWDRFKKKSLYEKNVLAHVVLLYDNDDGFKLAVVQKK